MKTWGIIVLLVVMILGGAFAWSVTRAKPAHKYTCIGPIDPENVCYEPPA